MQAPIEIPNFQLEKEIGRGGMAKVYLARQENPKRKVAIKIVSPGGQFDEDFLQQLKLEGDTVAQFSHANIVTVYACGVIDNHYYIAMEILSGGDLTKRIKDGDLTVKDALRVLREISSALEHAHDYKCLHRDIKPENIMFHANGKAVLVDFGIAKEEETESNFTRAGAVVGTPHYMAPERATGKPVDARSDLYALGVVFYEILTGAKLYEGSDTFAVSYAHVYNPIPELPAEYTQYQQLLNRLVAKDPDDRFQSAREVIKAIDALGSGGDAAAMAATQAMQPIQGPVIPAKPKQRFGKRPLAATAVAVTIVVASGAAYWLLGSGGGDPLPAPGRDMSVEDRLRMQDLLAAARAQVNIGNTDQAAENYREVLTEYDCTNEDAQRGLTALEPDTAAEFIARCRP